MRQLHLAAGHEGIALCGGHTEITAAVTRPVVSGQMVGVIRETLIDKRRMAPGDSVLVTKRAAVEGTAIMARELAARLREAGISDDLIERCRGFLHDPGITVLSEAKAALEAGGITAMHDVTEGGLATALHEFSVAGGRGLRVALDRIPVYPETDALCRALRADPLGLIGSGSLLITCAAGSRDAVVGAVRSRGVEIAPIGAVIDEPPGVQAYDSRSDTPAEWPRFAVDEIARLLEGEEV
jgi:hydrogenase maturation factor